MQHEIVLDTDRLLSCRGVSCRASAGEPTGQQLLTASGKPAEGPLDVFLGEPIFDMQVVFESGNDVREPYLAIAVDGTLLAVRNYQKQLRRSEDGGRSWGDIIEAPITHSDSNMLVDENTGSVMSVRMWDGADKVFRSLTTARPVAEETVIKPNELMKRPEETGVKKRATKGDQGKSGTYTARQCQRSGRHAAAWAVQGAAAREPPPSGRTPRPIPPIGSPPTRSFSCAVFSDDHGATWHQRLLPGRVYRGGAAGGVARRPDLLQLPVLTADTTTRPWPCPLRPEETLRREA